MKPIKCIFGYHSWHKVGGPHRIGGVKFEQMYKCFECNKVKYVEF